MALDGVRVHGDYFVQGVQRNITGERAGLKREEQQESNYRMLLSRLLKNFPRMLIAITRRPVSASISRTVKTVSYRMAFPTFFVPSVFVATF